MLKKVLALMLSLALLLPMAALGEATTLPFGLKLGMNATDAEAAFAADATLATVKYEKLDDGNGTVEYTFENVPVPDTDLTAYSLNVQIDQNNSAKADRLTMVSYNITPGDDNIAVFRELLTAMTTELGTPDADPFNDDGTAQYVEWGTLTANWTRDDVRVSLNISRMYEDSLSVMISSRVNYDKTDLQAK
jgi:hypothetical protein